MRLSAYAKAIGITYHTAYKHYRLGLIKGRQLATGTILINDSEIQDNTQKSTDIIQVALYARVSSSENKSNLITQLQRLRDYATAKGYQIVREVKEIGSGINDKRKKLLSLLQKTDYNIIIVEHKDRLARFGVELIKELLNQTGKKIELINTNITEKEDIIHDLISIITSFSAKIYGQRRAKRKTIKIINELNQFNGEGSKAKCDNID